MKEGEEGDFLFMIHEGSVDVYKNELKLSAVRSGELVGLMSLIDTKPRSATVIAGNKGASGFAIRKDGFNEIMNNEQSSIITALLLNYLKFQQNTVRNTNELSLREARARLSQEKKRVMSAHFFAQMVLGLVVFTFLLGYLRDLTDEIDSTFINFSFLGVYAIWSFFYVRNSGLAAASLGLDMSNFKQTIKPVLKATFIFIVGLFILKALLITFFPERFGTQFIELYKQDEHSLLFTSAIIVIYAVHAIFQEFIARGCIQGGLLQFIGGRWAQWKSIILAALMFSSFHLIIDVKYAFITVIPGLFWGYLFYKERNIMAISISHMLIGIVAIFILNLMA